MKRRTTAKWKPFSQRLKNGQRKPVKVFEYETFPSEFLTKLHYAVTDALSPLVSRNPFDEFRPVPFIRHQLAKQHATYSYESMDLGEIIHKANYTVVLDMVEWVWRLLRAGHNSWAEFSEEVNVMFDEYGIGYKIHEGEVLRVDAPAVTEEAIEPALTLLSEAGFEQAEKEFHDAIHHLRSGKPEDAVMWANAAFESTMKVILRIRKITFDEKNDTAKPLIGKVLSIPDLVPPYLSNYANHLAEVLQGLPTFRNKNPPAHGQGAAPSKMSREDAQFALNLAATFIVFLINRHRSIPK